MALRPQDRIDTLNYFNQPAKLKEILTDIRAENISTEVQLEDVDNLVLTALTAIGASYTDLPAARTSVNTLKTEVDARLDLIEAKVNEILEALKA